MSDKIILNNWVGDNLHIDSDIGRLDGCNKDWNMIITERETGKTTLMLKKAYNMFKRSNRPSILIRRYQTDITDMYIDDLLKTINEFTNSNLEFNYKKGQLKEGGQLDVKINGFDKVFLRIIALNAPLSRLKSMRLDSVKYMFFDEFICNKRIGERYLNDEPLRLKEIRKTYLRYTDNIKIYCFGNPYSLYNPIFSDKNVNTNDLYPGAFINKDNYCIWCYQLKPELRAKLLEKDKDFQFDEAYKRYAFDGRAIQDADIRVIDKQPEGFRLEFILKIHNKHIGVYHGCILGADKLFYWCKLLNHEEISKKRSIVCFDFGDMANRTILINNDYKKMYAMLKESIEHRWVAFNSIEESWLLEEIYQEI